MRTAAQNVLVCPGFLGFVFWAIRRKFVIVLALVLSTILLARLVALVHWNTRASAIERLKTAIRRCDASGSEALLKAGVNPSTPLYVSFLDLAIRCDDPHLVALLLRHGADPTQQSMAGYHSKLLPRAGKSNP